MLPAPQLEVHEMLALGHQEKQVEIFHFLIAVGFSEIHFLLQALKETGKTFLDIITSFILFVLLLAESREIPG